MKTMAKRTKTTGKRAISGRVSPGDAALLGQVFKDVEPLPGRKIESTDAEPSPDDAAGIPLLRKTTADHNAPELLPRREKLPALEIGETPGIDKRTAKRLKRGQVPIDARIDLHGMTRDQAHKALQNFIASSQNAGRRCALVITGKGYGPAGGIGVLKQAVPRWLNEQPNRSRILSFTHARPQDGGTGALYVYLKRLK